MFQKIFKNRAKPEEIGVGPLGTRMKMIVGLGNPGKQYEQTRHNIGFMVIDELSSSFNIPLTQAT